MKIGASNPKKQAKGHCERTLNTAGYRVLKNRVAAVIGDEKMLKERCADIWTCD